MSSPEPRAAPAEPSRRFGVLHNRSFRIYWLGQAVSLVGTWMQQVAGAWVVVGLTSSKTAIAIINFVASLPMILLTMQGGVMADRYDRRRILIVTQVLLAASAFAWAGLVASHHLTMPFVYALAIMQGVVIAYDLPAQQALVPDLVPRADIPQAIALNQAIFHGARLVGPAIAGVLMAATSPAMAMVANGVSYFAVVYSLSIISAPKHEAKARSGGGFKEGLRYIWAHRDVRALIGFAGLTTTFVFPFLIVFAAIYIKTVLAADAGAFGLVMSAGGLGAMLGALCLLRVPARLRGPLIIGGCVVAGGALAGISFAESAGAVAVLNAAVTFSVSLSLGLGTTIIQVAVPPDLRGRVMGVYGMMWTGLMPTMSLLLGVVADHIGLRLTLRLMAAAYLLTSLPWLAKARVHDLRS